MRKKPLLLIILIGIVIFASGCGQPDFYDNNAIKGKKALSQTEDQYLVYFYKPTCPYCIEYKPTLEQYEQKDDALTLYKVDLSKKRESKTWDIYDIKKTPTILHVKRMDDGEVKIVDKIVGVKTLEEIPTK